MDNSGPCCATSPKRSRAIEAKISRLSRRLSHRDWGKRAFAVYELGELGELAIPALLIALNDKTLAVWNDATNALARIGEPAAPALIERLGEKEGLGDAALFALVVMGERAVPALIGAFRRETEISANAAVALGRIGKPAVPALIETLKDPDKYVKRYACQALGIARDKSTIDALFPLLESDEKTVKWNAAWALEKIGPRGWEDLERVSGVAKKLKKEKKEVTHVVSLYSTWTKIAGAQARLISDSKRFHVPRIQRVDSAERVLRMRRPCA